MALTGTIQELTTKMVCCLSREERATTRESSNETCQRRRLLDAYFGLRLLATSHQHWTDQKLRVHAFLCVMAYLLVRLLWWRYRRQAPVPLSPRSLLAQLKKIRIVRVVELTGKRGRPRLHCQLEEMDQTLRTIGELTRAFPSL